MAIRLRRGVRLGKYTLEKKLGHGGFAEVWKARDTVEHHPVALKITEKITGDAARREIEREARIAYRLRHPHIVPIRTADWFSGRFVMVSDLAKTHLGAYPRSRRSPRIALSILRQVISALAHAHSHRVLHRDVKPENVLIFDDDHAALADFGVSVFERTVRRTYSEVGTLGYIAPEQAYGRANYTSDVFSVGIMAYDLLAGVILRWPFDWPAEGHDRLVERTPEPVIPVIRKAVQFDPRKRYADAMELLEAFDRALERAQPPARRPRRVRRKKKTPESPMRIAAREFGRRYGRGLEMRFSCYRCEGPIAEAMEHCPWCGADGQSFRDVTDYPLVCPECERGVRPEWRTCPWCYRGRFEGNGKLPRADAKAARRCSKPGCPGELRRFMRYCPICKTKPKRGWTHPDLHDRCPRCRWPVSRAYWRHCPWCGRREPSAGEFPARKSR